MSEPTPDDLQEREVLREWLHGAHADIRVVRRQVAALLRIAEGYEEHPLERPERAADGLMEVESIQYTPDRLQAVRDWLGDAYDKVRGGLSEDDPLVVWFDPSYGADHGDAGCRTHLARVSPGQWLVRDRRGLIQVMTAEEYRDR